MNTEKLYTVALTAQEIMLASAITGNTSIKGAAEDLDSFESYALDTSSGDNALFVQTKTPNQGKNNLSDKIHSLYKKFHTKLKEEVQEDFKPKTKTVYFCLYKNYNRILGTSGLFDTKQSMYAAIGQREIIEEFSIEIPV